MNGFLVFRHFLGCTWCAWWTRNCGSCKFPEEGRFVFGQPNHWVNNRKTLLRAQFPRQRQSLLHAHVVLHCASKAEAILTPVPPSTVCAIRLALRDRVLGEMGMLQQLAGTLPPTIQSRRPMWRFASSQKIRIFGAPAAGLAKYQQSRRASSG